MFTADDLEVADGRGRGIGRVGGRRRGRVRRHEGDVRWGDVSAAEVRSWVVDDDEFFRGAEGTNNVKLFCCS